MKRWDRKKNSVILKKLSIPEDMDELALAKTRFDGIEREARTRQAQLDAINQKRENFSPETPKMTKILEELNDTWKELNETLEQKSREFAHADEKQKFILDVQETEQWIGEKHSIIDNTRDYGDTLQGVLALQRKLGMDITRKQK